MVPMPLPGSAPVHVPDPERVTRHTELLVEATAVPLSDVDVLAALPRQGTLSIPAKLFRSRSGTAGMLVEIPAALGEEPARALAERTLALALDWFDGARPAATGPADTTHLGTTHLGDALSALGWNVTPQGTGTMIVHDAPGGPLTLHPCGDGSIRVAARPTVVRAPGAPSALALPRFALEANRRLRLARLTVTRTARGLLHVARDVILPPGVELAEWLARAADALVRARDETERAMRALTTPAVAAAYLATDGQPAGAPAGRIEEGR